jgi:CBS domain-containing protein
MPISDVCVRNVVTATADTTIEEAAELMRRNHVGDLLIVDRLQGHRVVQGILTDRDIVVAVVALGLDPSAITAGDVMSPELETVKEDHGILETIQKMSAAGIRRMPVVSQQGALVGIVSVDDLVQLLAEELGGLSRLIAREQRKEAHSRVG